MSDSPPPELDEVLDGAFLAAALAADPARVRAALRQASSAETDLAYYRRQLHGKLDIVRAELERRAGTAGELLERLPQILAGTDRGRRGVRSVVPASAPAWAGSRIDALVSEGHLARLPEMDDRELASLAERLGAEEASISSTRRRLLEIVDALRDELAARYRSGETSPSDVLPGATSRD